MSNLITAHGLTGFTEATFHHLGVPVYSAKTVRKVIGIWDSAVLDGTESLLNWKSVEYEATENDPTDRIYVFTRQGATSDLSAVEWSDPSLNEDTELTGDNRYIQVRVVIAAMVGGTPYQPGYGPGVGPTIERLIVKGITNATSSLFFTEAFELGFFPKSVVVTTESDGQIKLN
jgi:hypothetical protein